MTILKPALYVVGILLAAYLIRTVGRPSDADAVTARNQAIADAVAPFRDSMNALRAHESTFVRTAARLQFDAAAQAAKIRNLSGQLATATTARDTVIVQDSMLEESAGLLRTVEARCNALDSAFAGCAERAAFLQVRLDTLTAALGRQIRVSTCRVLFVPCLSRGQMFAVGILAGSIAGYVVAR